MILDTLYVTAIVAFGFAIFAGWYWLMVWIGTGVACKEKSHGHRM